MTNPTLPDLGPYSGAAQELIKQIGNAIGTLHEPRRIREEAKAKAEATLFEAKAQLDAERIKTVGKFELETELTERAEARAKYWELRRQANIESITAKAVHQLSEPAKIPLSEIDPDWLMQFFNLSQDISNEEIQLIWAKLLAGEFMRSGRYSLRALHTLRLLRPADALLFRQFCNYAWYSNGDAFVVRTPKIEGVLDATILSASSLYHLANLGLVIFTSTLNIILSGVTEASYFDQKYRLSVNGKVSIPAVLLSEVGKEIATLCECYPDDTYCQLVTEELVTSTVTVELLS